jgi:hypothetical protein
VSTRLSRCRQQQPTYPRGRPKICAGGPEIWARAPEEPHAEGQRPWVPDHGSPIVAMFFAPVLRNVFGFTHATRALLQPLLCAQSSARRSRRPVDPDRIRSLASFGEKCAY